MKLSDIAEHYDVPEADLEEFVKRYSVTYKHKSNFWDGSITLDESCNPDDLVKAFKEEYAPELERRQAEEQYEAEKNAAMARGNTMEQRTKSTAFSANPALTLNS